MATTKAFELGDLGINLTVDSSGTIQSLDISTTTVDEGTNLYFTDARARAAISVSGDLSYDSGTGVVSYTIPTTIASLGNHDTDDLAEGTGNLYFTSTRARASMVGGTGISYNSSTGNIALAASGVTAQSYGSASEVPVITVDTYGRITSASTTSVAGVSTFTFTDATGVLNISTADGGSFDATIGLASFDTTDLAEGTNLYYTDARAQAAISTDATLSYSAGEISMPATGVTAGSYGSSTQIPSITVDAQGRVTALSNNSITVGDATITVAGGTDLETGGVFTTNQGTDETITINHANITRTNTTSTDSPAHSGTFEAVTSVTTNARGHVTGVDTSTVTLPAGPNNGTITINGGTDLETGGAFTTDQANNETITIDHADITRTDTTSSTTATFGGTIDVVNSVTTNARGHVTAVDIETITLPSEADTLDTVADRGASTDKPITITATGANNSVSTDNARLSGYGIVGNRGTFYVTNNGTVQIGVGGTHNANSAMTFSSSVNTSNKNLSVQGNITTTGALYGPSTFYIDPSPVDTGEPGGATTDTGTVVILGDLQVTGETTTINSTVVTIDDKTLVLANNATTDAEANGAAVVFGGHTNPASIYYNSTNDRISVANVNGIEATTFYGALSGNATSATNADTVDGLHASQFLRSDASDTFTGSRLDLPTITAWTVSTNDLAHQRADARDDATNYSRLHWYGKSDSGVTSNFRHAWYDGTDYVNVDVSAGGVDFSGSANHMTIGGNTVFHDGYHPNADKWTTARTLSLTGDVTGSTSWDGSGNASITATVGDNSHNHTSVSSSFSITSGQLIGGIGARTTSGTTDWNHSTNARSGSGYTLLLGSHTNGPGGSSYYHPFSFEYNSKDGSGNMNQFAIPYSGTDGPYFRTRYSGTWSGWSELWHSNNDGSGSGLDADTVDGLQASQFLRSDASDTMSGNLTVTGNVYAPIFYDSDNNSFFINAAAGSRLNQLVTGSSSGGTTAGYGLDNYSNVHMHNTAVHYASQVHFNAGNRFQNNSNHYIDVKADATDYGGLRFINGSSTQAGYIYWDTTTFGVLNKDGQWALRTTATNTDLYYDGSNRLQTTSAGINVTGTVTATAYYGDGSNLTGIVAGQAYTESTSAPSSPNLGDEWYDTTDGILYKYMQNAWVQQSPAAGIGIYDVNGTKLN